MGNNLSLGVHYTKNIIINNIAAAAAAARAKARTKARTSAAKYENANTTTNPPRRIVNIIHSSSSSSSSSTSVTIAAVVLAYITNPIEKQPNKRAIHLSNLAFNSNACDLPHHSQHHHHHQRRQQHHSNHNQHNQSDSTTTTTSTTTTQQQTDEQTEKENDQTEIDDSVDSFLILTPEEYEEYLRLHTDKPEPFSNYYDEEFYDYYKPSVPSKSKYTGHIRSLILERIGKILRRIQNLDMHGGTTGDNTRFVHGLVDFIGGSLGGAAQVYVSQPLDTVKVKQQTFPERYKGMIDCFMKTYRQDGVARGLYAGSIPAVVANIAENSVLFAAYGGCQNFVKYLVGKEHVTELTVVENAFAGSFAAFFSTFTLCPTELIKCKLQALREMKSYLEPGMLKIRTPWGLTRHIYQTEGISGFYRGLGTTFMREMPGYFFFFGGYEGTRELLRAPDQSKDEIGPLRTMAAGAIGGITLWTSTFPADVIKSRIQVKNLNKGMIAVGMEIVKKEGFLALYTGLLPSILRTIPATATLFVVYEYTKKMLLGTM